MQIKLLGNVSYYLLANSNRKKIVQLRWKITYLFKVNITNLKHETMHNSKKIFGTEVLLWMQTSGWPLDDPWPDWHQDNTPAMT